jgi:DNA-binding MarR family transcriptional regulator
MRRPRKLRRTHSRENVRAVLEEAIALYHRLRWMSDQVYKAEGRSTARRGILRGLVRYGAQTVPKLARARSVTRQHVQEVVDALVREGYVELKPNPAHKRSPLVIPTARGERLVEEMDAIDNAVLGSINDAAPSRDLETTAKTLQRLREAFEVGRWRRVLE